MSKKVLTPGNVALVLMAAGALTYGQWRDAGATANVEPVGIPTAIASTDNGQVPPSLQQSELPANSFSSGDFLEGPPPSVTAEIDVERPVSQPNQTPPSQRPVENTQAPAPAIADTPQATLVSSSGNFVVPYNALFYGMDDQPIPAQPGQPYAYGTTTGNTGMLVEAGTTVALLGWDGNWANIQHAGYTGWVATR